MLLRLLYRPAGTTTSPGRAWTGHGTRSNDTMNIVLFLLIGGIAGWLAGKIMKGRGFGLWPNIAVGVLGALIGGSLFRQLGIEMHGLIGQLLTATVGAVALLWLAKLINKT